MRTNKKIMSLGVAAIALTAFGLVASCRTPNTQSNVKDEEDRPPGTQPLAQAAAAQMPTDPETVAAIDALKTIGAGTPYQEGPARCAGSCHDGVDTWHTAIHIDLVKKWGKAMQDVDTCMKGQTSARKKLRCMRTEMNDTAPWDKTKLGLWRAGAKTEEMQKMFKSAWGTNSGASRWKKYYEEVVMPKKDSPNHMSNADFTKLKTWVLGGMKKLDEAFTAPGGGGGGGETTCTDMVSNELMDHIRRMKTEGWGWKNVNNEQISMYGCPAHEGEYEELGTPLECFMDDTKWPLAHQKEYAKGWAEKFTSTGVPITQRIRVIKELPYQSTYWMRSSADGRFSASGLRGGGEGTLPADSSGFIVDFKDASRPHIGVSGPYDPGFFPDNKGFTFMGGGAYFCSQALIEDPNTTFVDFDTQTTYCGKGNMSVYQHVGANLAGGDYYVVRSDNYSNDDGAYGETQDPSPQSFATADAIVQIFPMQESGTSFKVGTRVDVKVPFEGDWGIFPAATLLTSRIAKREGAGAVQLGYRIRSFDVANKSTKELGTLCLKGGKATVSFNERVLATHHYTDANDAADFKMQEADPAFREMIENSSNIWVYDMMTKRKMRLTRMKKGQFALYPHWRSDGWLYFLVRDVNTQKDYVVATDAGIRIQK